MISEPKGFLTYCSSRLGVIEASPMDKRIGVVGIIIENRKDNATRVNHILSSYAGIIMGRMGLPCKERNISIITLNIEATTDDIGAMTGKLGMIQGVKVKTNFV